MRRYPFGASLTLQAAVHCCRSANGLQDLSEVLKAGMEKLDSLPTGGAGPAAGAADAAAEAEPEKEESEKEESAGGAGGLFDDDDDDW